MSTKLLDTTFLIDYWAGESDVRAYLEEHEGTGEFATTTLNLKELAVGRRLQGRFDRAELEATFEWVRIVPFTDDHAVVASALEVDLHSSGDHTRRQIDSLQGDLLVAAVADELNAAVVTRNEADFRTLGVPVETY